MNKNRYETWQKLIVREGHCGDSSYINCSADECPYSYDRKGNRILCAESDKVNCKNDYLRELIEEIYD